MNTKIFKSALIATGIVALSAGAQAQKAQSGPVSSGFTIPVGSNGSVAMSLKGKELQKTAISSRLNGMFGLSNKHSFTEVGTTTDKQGFTHVAYQQYYQGVLVDGGKVLVHFKNGIADNINGKVAMLGNLEVSPVLNKDEAFRLAAKEADVNKAFRQYPVQLVIAGFSSGKMKEYALAYKVRIDGKTSERKTVMLNVFVDAQSGRILNRVSLMAHTDVTATANTFYSGTRTIVTDSTGVGEFRLRDNARKIETYNGGGVQPDAGGVQPAENKDYWNNSTNWDLFNMFSATRITTASSTLLAGVGSNNAVLFAIAQGVNADTLLDGPQFVNISSPSSLPVTTSGLYTILSPTGTYSGAYLNYNFTTDEIEDTARYAIANTTPGTYAWSDTHGNSGTYTIAQKKNPALDAHWGMEQTHDFYSSRFGRNSYDNAGSVVRNYVNYGDQFNASAAPDPYNFMMYGLGGASYMAPVVGLDVMGHEFTHMVTEHNGNGGLDYQGESGALNESFSDIFGTSIEFYTKGTAANWTIGEGIILGAPGFFRSMANPKLVQNPDTYGGQFWVDPNSTPDQGGVHTNSGVQNKWFYLLTTGGAGINDKGNAYAVTGIGIGKADSITYRNLTTYIMPSSDYLDAYKGSLQSALDLYGDSTSVEYKAVKEAWYAVGIGEKPTIGISEVAVGQHDLQLYPNPATNRVTISSAINQELQAQILNVMGIPVMTISVSKGLNPVDISTLAKGIYMIRYNTGTKGYVQKLSVL